MKNCNQCYYYKKTKRECKKFEMQVTDTEVFGMCCKEYSKKVIVKVQCKNCCNMNKYGWCMIKKRCFNEEEVHKDRQCRHYFKRKHRTKKVKY